MRALGEKTMISHPKATHNRGLFAVTPIYSVYIALWPRETWEYRASLYCTCYFIIDMRALLSHLYEQYQHGIFFKDMCIARLRSVRRSSAYVVAVPTTSRRWSPTDAKPSLTRPLPGRAARASAYTGILNNLIILTIESKYRPAKTDVARRSRTEPSTIQPNNGENQYQQPAGPPSNPTKEDPQYHIQSTSVK